MATLNHAKSQFDYASAIGDRFSALLAQFHTAWMRRRSYNQTWAELAGCSDSELADIGIPRDRLRHVAWEHACNVVDDGGLR